MVASGHILPVTATGTARVRLQGHHVLLPNSLLVPQFRVNLMGVKALTKLGCKAVFDDEKCLILSPNRTYVAESKKDLYIIDFEPVGGNLTDKDLQDYYDQRANDECWDELIRTYTSQQESHAHTHWCNTHDRLGASETHGPKRRKTNKQGTADVKSQGTGRFNRNECMDAQLPSFHPPTDASDAKRKCLGRGQHSGHHTMSFDPQDNLQVDKEPHTMETCDGDIPSAFLSKPTEVRSSSQNAAYWLAHYRTAHRSAKSVMRLTRCFCNFEKTLQGKLRFPIHKCDCEDCAIAKITKRPHGARKDKDDDTANRAIKWLGRIHSDICGEPFPCLPPQEIRRSKSAGIVPQHGRRTSRSPSKWQSREDESDSQRNGHSHDGTCELAARLLAICNRHRSVPTQSAKSQRISKLSGPGVRGIFVGYHPNMKNGYIIRVKHKTQGWRIIVSNDVRFFEHEFLHPSQQLTLDDIGDQTDSTTGRLPFRLVRRGRRGRE
mmetsp:Transcript_7689/g.18835  ORF Transcript_7689/g.18835 Transcript_7689/m.18835 type:complete len:492 (+) Transcript_7689:1461-2936(+)